MIRCKDYLFMIVLIMSVSCNKNKTTRELLMDYYSSGDDSLKREAALFILDNMSSSMSEIPVIIDELNCDSRIIDFSNDNIEQLRMDIGLNKKKPSLINIPDSQIVNCEFLIDNIELSFLTWNKYPWSKKVPKDVFFEYLLPYKILKESNSNWRNELNSLYLNDELYDSGICNENDLYYKIVVDCIGREYKYTPSPLKFSNYSGYNEMKAIKQVECFNGSYLGVYALRALGIPSTVDFVPLWGSRNSGHTTEVFWDMDCFCFRTASGRDLGSKYPAKVFRFSFKKQNNWTDKICHIVGDYPFLLSFLKHDNWIDVTHEHTKTISIW